MRIIGIATVSLLLALAAGAAYVGIQAIPDIKRYLKVRQM